MGSLLRGGRPLSALASLVLLAALAGCGSDPASPNDPGASPGTGTCSATPVSGTPNLTTVRVATGFRLPIDLQAPPGDRARLFVVEQGGRIRILRAGAIVEPPFLDISGRIRSGGEQGLLGLAFHPRYAETGRFYVNYTDRSGDTHISEFRVSSNPDVADAGTERQLLFVDQPFDNHNGGGLAFGNDGFLYVGLGDGGSGGDPMHNGQSLGTPLGKMLRIDVNTGSPFGVPSDNPFLARPGAFPAIWAYGLRNPWRFSFDRATGDLYIGDVGQGAVEEVDVGAASRRGGENYGWNVMEGDRCFSPSSNCDRTGLTQPVAVYSHDTGCSITGGYVYRGCRMPGYAGTYFYGDYCTSIVRSFRFQGGAATDTRDWTVALGRGLDNISSFGVDAEGEIYILDHADGEVYRIVPAS